MQLYVVRHGEARAGEPDALRPLTPHGRTQARDVGRRLAAEGVRPDALLTSPLLRARETAEIVGQELGVEAEVDDRLAPGATAAGVRAAVAGRGDVVVTIGHQPDCGQIAAELSGAPAPPFPAGGMCRVDL